MSASGCISLDAPCRCTCKRVAKVHAVIKKHARRGFHTVIVGDADHAEVIVCWVCEGRATSSIDGTVDDSPGVGKGAAGARHSEEEVFEEIRARFLQRFPTPGQESTCDSTQQRKAEVRQCDARCGDGGVEEPAQHPAVADVARNAASPPITSKRKQNSTGRIWHGTPALDFGGSITPIGLSGSGAVPGILQPSSTVVIAQANPRTTAYAMPTWQGRSAPLRPAQALMDFPLFRHAVMAACYALPCTRSTFTRSQCHH